MMRRGTTSWNSVKTIIKETLEKYSPEAVKAEIIWDHVKTEIPTTKGAIYGVLSRMNKEGEIERVSLGWYQLPGSNKRLTPDPVWQMGYDEGYKKGYKDAIPPTADFDRIKEKMMQILLDKLVLEAQKVHPDPRRLLLIVEMMKEITGGCWDANS